MPSDKDVCLPVKDSWCRLREAYKKAIVFFKDCEVGIRLMEEDIRFSMVYIKGKSIKFEEMSDVDLFVDMISDSYKIHIGVTDDGKTEIDIIFIRE